MICDRYAPFGTRSECERALGFIIMHRFLRLLGAQFLRPAVSFDNASFSPQMRSHSKRSRYCATVFIVRVCVCVILP